MENASKALYMAAGILISFLILAILINVFKAGAKLNEDYDFKQSKEQLELFNSKFEIYDRKNNNISDIISVINLAYSNNKSVDYDQVKSISIYINIGNAHFWLLPKQELKKNEIFIDKSIPANSFSNLQHIYLYDFLEKKVDEINTNMSNSNIDGEDKLSKMYCSNETNNEIVYKYLFECTKIEYNSQTGRVSKMEFKCDKNNDKWNKDFNGNYVNMDV